MIGLFVGFMGVRGSVDQSVFEDDEVGGVYFEVDEVAGGDAAGVEFVDFDLDVAGDGDDVLCDFAEVD